MAGETRKNYFDRFCEEYNAICEEYPLAWELDMKDGFEVIHAGRRVAYFSQIGIDFE
jgi:hypothetical protein